MQLLESLLAPDRSTGDWLRRHGLFWLVFTSVATVSWMYWYGSFVGALAGGPLYIATNCIPVTYLLLYFALPKLLHGQYGAFCGRMLVWIALSMVWRSLLTPVHGLLLPATKWATFSWRFLFDATFKVSNNFVVAAAALKLFRYQYQQQLANQQLARETLAIKLKTLQAQMQPHFLFNILNTIYSLALRQSAQAGPAVRQLEALLQYIFREGNAVEVELRQEVDLLRSYAALEQLRYGPRLQFSLHVEGELAGRQLAPLLLLPFVENAFKHGVSEQVGQVFIDIKLLARHDTLHVLVRNSVASLTPGRLSQPGGLGLNNVRQRLALLYPGRHRLEVQAAATEFLVELTLPLHVAPNGPCPGPVPGPLLLNWLAN